MKSKIKNKSLFVLAMAFVFLLLLSINVNAASSDDHVIEGYEYIIYNPVYDTEDVEINQYKDEGNFIYITKSDIEQSEFNEIVNDIQNNMTGTAYIEVDSNAEEVRSVSLNASDDSYEELEIVEINGTKYAKWDYEISDLGTNQYEDSYIYVSISEGINLEIFVDGESTTDHWGFQIYYTSENLFEYTLRVVSDTGYNYGEIYGTNGLTYFNLYPEIPSNLDLENSYLEMLSNTYLGTTVDLTNAKNLAYVGKYGEYYKYRISMDKVEANDNGFFETYSSSTFSYKGSHQYGGFQFSDDYEVEEVTYTSQTQSASTSTMKYSLNGNFNGTLKVEEIEKDDLIYSKVNAELIKHSSNNVYLEISNIYIEDGSYDGVLKITFNVGEEYNGKDYYIVHMIDYLYNFEIFEGTVEDGKITITVNSLSPFGIAISGETTTSSDELDNTPKTGTSNNIAQICSAILLMSTIGLAIIKFKK